MYVLDLQNTLGIIFLLKTQYSLADASVLLVMAGFISLLKIYSGDISPVLMKGKLIHFHI